LGPVFYFQEKGGEKIMEPVQKEILQGGYEKTLQGLALLRSAFNVIEEGLSVLTNCIEAMLKEEKLAKN
jgi:hypothetical protein